MNLSLLRRNGTWRRRVSAVSTLILIASATLLLGTFPALSQTGEDHAHIYAAGGVNGCEQNGGRTVTNGTEVDVVMCAHNPAHGPRGGVGVSWGADQAVSTHSQEFVTALNGEAIWRVSTSNKTVKFTGTLETGEVASVDVTWQPAAPETDHVILVTDGENCDDPLASTTANRDAGQNVTVKACVRNSLNLPVSDGIDVDLVVDNLGSAGVPTPASKDTSGGEVTFTVGSDTAGKARLRAVAQGVGSNEHISAFTRPPDHVHTFVNGNCETGHGDIDPGPHEAVTGQDIVVVGCVHGEDNDGIPDSRTDPSTGTSRNQRVGWSRSGVGSQVGSFESRTDVNGEARATYRSETPGAMVVTVRALEDTEEPFTEDSITINFSGQACDDHIHGRLARNFQAYPGFDGGVFVGSGNLRGSLPGPPEIVTGADRGGGPHVKVFSRHGALMNSWFAYPSGFRGGVRVAVGDVTGNSRPEIITAPGAGGGPHIRVRTGGGAILAEWMAYPPGLTTGVFVAAADIDGDGKDEVITAPDRGGGPHVKVFDVESGGGTSILEFMAYDTSFRGGVRVAGGQVDGESREEIVTGAGPGGGPHVRVFGVDDDGDLDPGGSWMAYPSGFSGGVFVGVGNYHLVSFDPAGAEEIITGAGATGGPHVKAFRFTGVQIASFFAFGTSFTGGVRVASSDTDPCDPDLGSVLDEMLAAQGPGGVTEVRQYQ